MDLDSKAHVMLVNAWNTHGGSEDYRRILERLGPLAERHDHETPEMWCSHIRDPFRKILEEHHTSRGSILSGNGYITMYGKLYENDKVHGYPTNYIYCSVCDSLVFISENGLGGLPITYWDNHLKVAFLEIVFRMNMQEERIFSNLLIIGNLRSGNISNSYYKKRQKLSISN